jgi:hypothetical protein
VAAWNFLNNLDVKNERVVDREFTRIASCRPAATLGQVPAETSKKSMPPGFSSWLDFAFDFGLPLIFLLQAGEWKGCALPSAKMFTG